MSTESILKSIEDEETPIASLEVGQLSDLEPSSAAIISASLSSLSLEREKQLLDHLINISEDRFDVNFDELFARKLQSERPEIRELSIKGLWECNERSLISTLLDLLRKDDADDVRIAAAIGLRKFSVLAQEGKLLDRDSSNIYQSLITILDDDSYEMENEFPIEIRRRAIEALSPYDDPKVHEIILDNYHSLDEELRASAIFSMGENGNSEWIPYILEEMENPNPEIRFEAVGALGRIGDEALIPDLARMANDVNFEVISQVITALNLIGGPTAIKVLKRFLQHDNTNVRSLAQDVLENMEKEQLSIEEISNGDLYKSAASSEEENEEIFSEFDEGLEDFDE
tara:strand:+ start:17286 stop:18314 length:1029 start_codon:yes stop_codon:yes gene_type:complete